MRVKCVSLEPRVTGASEWRGMRAIELAPGPVEMRADVLCLGGSQPKYFRTEQFSEWMLALKAKFLRVLGLDSRHEIIFLTGSGTAGMEAVAANFLPGEDHLAISSGQFGDRMCEISRRRRFRFDRADIDTKKSPQINLGTLALSNFKSCFSTISETSNGYFINPTLIREAGLPQSSLLLCDGISAAFSDDFDIGATDALIIGSQKGLGLFPGMCFIVLSEKAVNVVRRNKKRINLYYDFNLYIENMKRGQTPFTPSLSVLYQLDRALDNINEDGGLGVVTTRRKTLADRFRMRLDGYGIDYTRKYVSNCVTVIRTGSIDAEVVSKDLRDKYNITVATNSPPLKNTHFRVSHMGNNTMEEMDLAAEAIWFAMREYS